MKRAAYAVVLLMAFGFGAAEAVPATIITRA